jgi:pimeloyl-ACP methyl ester carboxylesterase
MSKRMMLCRLITLVLALIVLPVSQLQISAAEGSKIKISSYMNDPFVEESLIGRMDASRFDQDSNGYPFLSGDRVQTSEETFIYRRNSTTGMYEQFAWNPWPKEARSNDKGNFKFSDEERFSLHLVERDADGKVILRDGKQVWTPRDLYLGDTTAFAAAHAARDGAEVWAGRDLPWGVDNLLDIEAHAFIEPNAFYSGNTRSLFFGVVPYRLPGETQIKMFETATSWEIAAHESGHALHDVLKPNQDISDPGYDTWGESLGDQIAMWASLRNPERVRGVIAETSGDLYKSNSLTRMGEFSASLTGRGTGVRDAFHNKKVSDTTEEVHDRSEVLTGAAYKVFTLIYNGLKNGQGNEHAALTEAADIMGVFLTHTADFTPENRLTLEDLGKAYLKVDKELFGGRYHTMFADEFINREIFNTGSVGEWMAHEAAVPQLRLPKRASIHKLERLVQGNLDLLGIGPDFGLKLQSVTRDGRFGKTIVRVQLTDGRSSDAALLDNHGILTFRADGTLADYHTPLPSEGTSPIQTQSHVRALAFVNQAKQLGLDRRGGLLSIVRRPDGQLTVESRVMRSEGIYCWIEAFTFEHPEGERREVIVPTIPGNLSGIQPNGVQILTASDLNK